MSTPKSPSYDELKRRLEAAESALKAIREGRVDTIPGEQETLVVRLAEAEARQAHLKQVMSAIPKVNRLEESHRYLGLVIEGSGVGTWEWNVRTNETRFNEQWAAMLGYTIEELTPYDYTTWKRLVHPEDLEHACRALADCVVGITTDYKCEFRMKHKDGQWVWILDQGRIMTHDDTGKALSMFGTHTDITRIKQAEESLRESESRFRSIFENAPIGIALVDLDYRLLASNQAYGDLLGRDESEIQTLLLKDFTHPDDLEENLRLQSRLGRGEIDQYSLEKRFVRKNGAVRWGHLTACLIRDSNGDPLNFLGHVLDITDRKQAENDLRRQQRSLDLYNRIATVFLTTSGDEVFAGVLDVILRLLDSRFGYFGYIDEAGNLVCPSMTRDVWDQCRVAEKCIVFPRSGWGGLWGRSLLEKRTLVANENLRPPQGHVALENALAAPIVHHDTLIGQFVVASKAGGYSQEDRELLETAAAQTAPILFAIREEARQKIAHEKLEAQLRQAQKMEAVGRLAGGVAHDFNNMLFIILGNVEMLSEDQPADGPFRKNLEAIRKAAEGSADLTRQLLAFARKQTVAPRVIDLNKTVESMLNMLWRLIGEDIDMAWIPGGNVQPVKIDPGQIDQILANLCVNARDAIAGVGKVTIETGNTAFDEAYCGNHAGFTPGEYVMLAVSDNGCGMDEETCANIFEPFFTTKDVGKGTGLGLATLYGAVKQNNGFINVYSERGHGTTFKIYLPRHKPKTAPVPEKGPDKPSERGRETILLVEDEPSVLKMTTMMLVRQGYTVVGASTPGDAVRLAAEHAGHIHLLMTDVVMPEMNGRDLAQNILSLYPGLKCLFMSGYTANVIAHHGVLDEAVNFIQKPFSKDDLAVKLRKVLAQN